MHKCVRHVIIFFFNHIWVYIFSCKSAFITWMTIHTGVRGWICGCDAVWLHAEAGGGRRRCEHLSPPHLSFCQPSGSTKPPRGWSQRWRSAPPRPGASTSTRSPSSSTPGPSSGWCVGWASSATCGLALMSRPACTPISLSRFSFSADRIIRNHYFFCI